MVLIIPGRGGTAYRGQSVNSPRGGGTPAELRAERLPGRQVAVRPRRLSARPARLDPRRPPCFWSSEDSAPPSVPATGGPFLIGAASGRASIVIAHRSGANDHVR